MTWIKLEDKTPRHPKVAGLSDRAFRVWIHSLCYASEFLTDGLLPVAFMRTVKQSVIYELVSAGLWLKDGDGSITIHDYLEHQTPRSRVEDQRIAARERRKKSYQQSPIVRANNSETNSERNRPDTEDRIQKTETETEKEREKPRARVESGSNLAHWNKHRNHVNGFCDFVCLEESQFNEFIGRVTNAGFTDPAGRVLAWAQKVLDDHRANQVVPGENRFKFWDAEWERAHPRSRPSVVTQDPIAAARTAHEAQLAARGKR